MRTIRFVCLFVLFSAYPHFPIMGVSFAEETVRIGVTLALSGSNQEWGKRTLAGVRMRVDEWNISGGNPYVELVIRDDAGNGEKSAENVKELVDEENVTALIGPGRSAFLLAEREYLRQKKVVAISPNATNGAIGENDDWIFRLMFDDAFQTRALAEYAYNVLHLRHVAAIVNTYYPYSESVYKSFSEAFKRLGGEMVVVESISWKYCSKNEYDFGEALRSVAGSGADALLLPLFAPEVIDIMNQSLTAGLNVVFLGAESWESEGLMEAGGKLLRNAYYVSGMNSGSGTPEMEHFISRYNESEEPYVAFGSVFGYDAMSILLHALSGADPSNPNSFRDRLFEIKEFPLASGTITIDRRLGTRRPAYIHRVVEDGHWFKSKPVGTVYPK